MSVGTRLKQLRRGAGLEIKEAAHRVGKTYQYVRQLEEGPNEPPTWELLAKFAEIYDCSVDEILGVERDSEEKQSLPEGGKELLEYLGGMSDRSRATLLTIARGIHELDQDYQAAAMASNSAVAVGGLAELIQLKNLLASLAIKFGSEEAALDYIDSIVLADSPRSNEVNEAN